MLLELSFGLLFVVTRIAIVETIFRRGGLKPEAQSWGCAVADLCRVGLFSRSNRQLHPSSHRKDFQEHHHCDESLREVRHKSVWPQHGRRASHSIRP